MDEDASKAAVALTTKVVESVGPTVVKKILEWRPFKSPEKIAPSEANLYGAGPGQIERRKSGVDMRLRIGSWFAYHRQTYAGPNDVLYPTQQTMDHLCQALCKEVEHYQITDRHSWLPVDPYSAVDTALQVTWRDCENAPKQNRQAKALVEAAAMYIFSHYNVRRTDRGQQQSNIRAAG